ncbi:N-formylglutamate amidohydrolase [Sphingomonas sinipercae]|uniref:N-formylglutamate amidohydrolase n=1 Tax=Sphingomonas sinipercae TaxID=2714944 RepID=A0A6G7ZKZ2_9SPHN|nr:N-formylglutamate amidohydrolase [Sphingomonas sinipercae]QIL01588.1 N-formylglutamate amidohydrolase [Sphingomonas sinipercae]
MEEKSTADHRLWWTVQRGDGPVLATAIHDGNGLRPEIAAAMKLADADRLREEDPFTGQAIVDVPTHVIAHRSRFEFDLNRGGQDAIYRTADQSWGLEVWDRPLSEADVAASLAIHNAYYAMLGQLLDSIAERHPKFVLIDVHSYNHRRDGSDGDPMPQDKAPDINIGTFSMPREQWAWLLDPLMEGMAGFDFNGRRLDVRENVAFQGKGEQTRFVHDRYPGQGCAIALEFKKFFMDEWTGQPDPAELDAMRRFITFIAGEAERLLK